MNPSTSNDRRQNHGISPGAVVPASIGRGCAKPERAKLVDHRDKLERIVDFLSDLERIHSYYRELNSRERVKGNVSNLVTWASEIGRTHFNSAGGITPRPVGAQRVHMLEILDTEPIDNGDIIRKLLLEDASQPMEWQKEQAYNYACYLVSQIKHSCRLEASGKQVMFPVHFEPGAALLAMRNWPTAFSNEEFEAGIKLLGPMLNWWYG